MPDVTVVGAGPNGLAAAAVMARAGLSVEVFEAAGTIGGGTRTRRADAAGPLPRCLLGSAPHGSGLPFLPCLRARPPDGPGHSWSSPSDHRWTADGPPWPTGRWTGPRAGLGRDGAAYRQLMAPLVRRIDGRHGLYPEPAASDPQEPGGGRHSSGCGPWNRVPGCGTPGSGSHGARAAQRRGGPCRVPPALPGCRRRRPDAGGPGPRRRLAHSRWAVLPPSPAPWQTTSGPTAASSTRARPSTAFTDLPPARATLLDVAPRGLLDMAGDPLPGTYRQLLESFRYGNGSCKVDFILSGPVPVGRQPELADAGTVHVGGTREELARAENEVTAGRHPERPYVLVAQPSRFDASRAPAGRHILWTYCHVPAGSTKDMRRPSPRSWNGSRPDSGTWWSRPTSSPRRNSPATTGTTSAGTSARGPWTSAAWSSGPSCPRPMADPVARRLPVFLVHAARPRSHRDARAHAAKYALRTYSACRSRRWAWAVIAAGSAPFDRRRNGLARRISRGIMAPWGTQQNFHLP